MKTDYSDLQDQKKATWSSKLVNKDKLDQPSRDFTMTPDVISAKVPPLSPSN